MLKKIYRFFAWVIILVVIVGILLAAMAIAGSWLLNERVTGEILQILDGIQSGLSVIENSLQRLDDALSGARELTQTILSTAEQLGERIEEGSPVMALLTKSVNEDLVSKITAARETLIAIRDSVSAFNAALVAINAMPFIEVPTLTDELQTVADRLADLALVVQELRSLVSQVKVEVAETLTAPIIQTATRIDDELAAIQTALQGFIQQVDGVQSAVAALQANVPVWIDIATIAVSLFFLWIITAQFAMLAIARGYLRTGYLPWSYPLPLARTEAAPADKISALEPPAEAAEAEAADADAVLITEEQAEEIAQESGEEQGSSQDS